MYLKAIDITKKYSTGRDPIHVICEDDNEYICKYPLTNDERNKKATVLFNEYIATRFLECWEIPTPKFQIVTLSESLVVENKNKFPKLISEFPCFASAYIKNAIDINDEFYKRLFKQKAEFQIKTGFNLLNIVLFDIWVSNEDRSKPNNLNLITKQDSRNIWQVYAIDHGLIFNQNLDKELAHLAYEETIFNSALIEQIFTPQNIAKVNPDVLNEFLKAQKEEFYICVSKCENELKEILDGVPAEWNIPYDETENALRTSIFSEKWKTQTFETYREEYLLYKALKQTK